MHRERALTYCERDLEKAMLKDPPDLKAAAAFALTSGEARVVLRQRDAGILMFQQAINMARVALDPLGEVRAFKLLNIYVYVHTYVCVCTYVYTYVCMYLCVFIYIFAFIGPGLQPTGTGDDVTPSGRRYFSPPDPAAQGSNRRPAHHLAFASSKA